MRIVQAEEITRIVRKLCIESCTELPFDIRGALCDAAVAEGKTTARDVLKTLIRNYRIAKDEEIPICQDTGMACVFVELGQDVHIEGSLLCDAVNEGVRQGYREGYLRKSVVADPLRRENTGDNTPCVLHTEIVAGEEVRITVAPKGFGSENRSRIAMLKPSDGLRGVKEFITETVRLAGPDACPPYVIGVGIGGTFEQCALFSKKALLRNIDERNPDPFYAELESELLASLNALDIGPQGFGGCTTALCVNIEACPTHIAGLPCAVNIGCHVTRRKTEVI